MSTYISLLRFTDQGASNIKKSSSRAAAFDRAAEKAGVEIVGQYWMFGEYDGLLILSAEREEQILHCLTELVAAGNVRTHTMQAFDMKAFTAIARK